MDVDGASCAASDQENGAMGLEPESPSAMEPFCASTSIGRQRTAAGRENCDAGGGTSHRPPGARPLQAINGGVSPRSAVKPAVAALRVGQEN